MSYGTNLGRRVEQYFASDGVISGARSTFRDGFGASSGDHDGAIVRRLYGDAHRCDKTAKHMAMGRAISALDFRSQQTLLLAFGGERWPPDVSAAFPTYTGVALITGVAKRHDPEKPGRWLQGVAARREARAMSAVNLEIRTLVKLALRELEVQLVENRRVA